MTDTNRNVAEFGKVVDTMTTDQRRAMLVAADMAASDMAASLLAEVLGIPEAGRSEVVARIVDTIAEWLDNVGGTDG